MPSENRRDPITSREHFACYLRVTGFIRTDQTKLSQTVKEEKRAETSQQQGVCARAIGHGGGAIADC